MGRLTAAARESETVRGRSREAASAFAELRALPPAVRWPAFRTLDEAEIAQVMRVSTREAGSPFALWQDDWAAFASHVLGQTLWRKQRIMLRAAAVHRRVAVPSAFGTGKTMAAAMAVCAMAATYPAGTTTSVTTATRFRQVRRQIWPEIRLLHGLAGLPGTIDTAQWKMPSRTGDVDVAYGFTVPPTDEEALQGIHARGALLAVVDEAGGMARTIGDGFRALLTGPSTHLLAIGNPPTDDDDSWFEQLCATDGVVVVKIPVGETPNFTGERTGRCRACPPELPAHEVGEHLVDRQWEEETRRDHGETSAYYVAKAKADFPKNATRRAIPSAWIDAAVEYAESGTGQPVRVRDRLTGQPAAAQPPDGAWVRLGVDVAADGGDEFVIARVEEDIARIRHVSSGADNAHAVNVAGVVLDHIREAEALARELGSAAPVRVKIDVIGLGWGVAGILEAWGAEQLHSADIVRVDVSEKPDPDRVKAAEAATLRPRNKRAELWLATRSLLQPVASPDGQPSRPGLLLDVDRRTAAQLAGPDYGTDASGRTYIESKESLRRRGLSSPDRAEAVLLAVYEPHALGRRKRRLIITGA